MHLRRLLSISVLTVLTSLMVSCSGGGEETGSTGVTADMLREGIRSGESAQEARKGTAAFRFEQSEFEWGSVPYGRQVRERISFENTGDEPLVIYDFVADTEGITIDFPSAPVEPGKRGEIIVYYRPDSDDSGTFNYTLQLTANTPEGGSSVNITGEVVGGQLANVTGGMGSLQAGGNGNTDRYGRPPGDPHYQHNHPIRPGEPGYGSGQQGTQQQNQEDGVQRDEYGRTPDNPHFGHNHPPGQDEDLQQQQQQDIERQIREQMGSQEDGEKDQYGRSPGDPHYGHNHPPGPDEQQGSNQETDEYGRTPDDPHFGHNHPPQNQQGQQQQGQQQQQPGSGWEVESVPDPNAPKISFEKTEHNFGTVAKGTRPSYDFQFTNTGKSPLVINNVRASCGCTAPAYSREPIPPGESGFVTVEYNTDFRDSETINQSVTVETNTDQGSYNLRIRGRVE